MQELSPQFSPSLGLLRYLFSCKLLFLCCVFLLVFPTMLFFSCSTAGLHGTGSSLFSFYFCFTSIRNFGSSSCSSKSIGTCQYRSQHQYLLRLPRSSSQFSCISVTTLTTASNNRWVLGPTLHIPVLSLKERKKQTPIKQKKAGML